MPAVRVCQVSNVSHLLEAAVDLFLERQSDSFSVQEVADLMRVSSMTVYRLIKAGDLPAVRVGRSFRVRDSDVDAYLAARYTQAG